MKITTNLNITPHSDRPPATNYLYKPAKPIPEGYVTLEEFMTNLLNAIDQHYAGKKDNR